jgi:transcriptional regulator with XRE-family HTH domain
MKSSDHTTPEMGRVIALARRARGMTLRQLGERIGVSAQAVHKWERGVNYPDITLLPMIARVLEVSIEDLFG